MHFYGLATTISASLSILPLAKGAQTKTIIAGTVTVVGPTTPPSAQYTEPPVFKDAVLNSSNTFRHQHDAVALVWNDTLAKFAGKAAEPCKFAHTGGPYGENLAEGYENVTAAIDFWGYERDLYNFNKGDFDAKWGHFTQLVWQNTTDVGCGAKNCGKEYGWLMFCDYSPRGNIIGEFKDNVKKQSNSDVSMFEGGSPGRSSPRKGGSSGGGSSGSDSSAAPFSLIHGYAEHPWFKEELRLTLAGGLL